MATAVQQHRGRCTGPQHAPWLKHAVLSTTPSDAVGYFPDTLYIGGGAPAPAHPDSQPAIDVPQWSTPGGFSGMASPAAPTNRYHLFPPTPVAAEYPLQPALNGTSPIQSE